MHIFALAFAFAPLLVTFVSPPASAASLQRASPREDDPEDVVPKEMVMLPNYTFIRTDWSPGPPQTSTAARSSAAAIPRSAAPFDGRPSGFLTAVKRQEEFVETTVRELQITVSSSSWSTFDPLTVTVTASSSLVDIPRTSSPSPPPTALVLPSAHMSMSSYAGGFVSSSAKVYISSSAGMYVSSSVNVFVSSSANALESSAVGMPGILSATGPGNSLATALKPTATHTPRTSSVPTSSRPPAPTVNATAAGDLLAPKPGIKDNTEPVVNGNVVLPLSGNTVIIVADPSTLDLPGLLGGKGASVPASPSSSKPLYKNRKEYLERNYNWLRCRTQHTPFFDVGGGWVDDGGKRVFEGLAKWLPQCLPINNKVTYYNGQDWGDGALKFDCFFPFNNLRTIVKALEKTGNDYAVDHRRKLYIFNCAGFNEYPASGLEPKQGG